MQRKIRVCNDLNVIVFYKLTPMSLKIVRRHNNVIGKFLASNAERTKSGKITKLRNSV